jgi:formylglycine-generating enzyme required for sulfatase activity
MWFFVSLFASLVGGAVFMCSQAAGIDIEGQTQNNLGWAKEQMPPGLQKAEQPNEYIWKKDGSVMVYIPAGSFSMGENGRLANESPAHMVSLDAFYIDKYEVTLGAFRHFADSMKYKTTAEQQGNGTVVRPGKFEQLSGKSWRDPGFVQDDNHPVVLVSWNDAKAYATWSGKSLPTEAQWEKAASWNEAAPKDQKKILYPWGNSDAAGRGAGRDNLLKLGNFADVSFGELMPMGMPLRDLLLHPYYGGQYNDGYVYTAPVDMCEPGKSPYGAFDMSGNVWEWCEDGYAEDFYSHSLPPINPVNTDGHKGRVIRGSGYDTPCTSIFPSTYRGFVSAEGRMTTIGFRCAIWAPKK